MLTLWWEGSPWETDKKDNVNRINEGGEYGKRGNRGIRRSQHEEQTLELKPKWQERTRLAKLGDTVQTQG